MFKKVTTKKDIENVSSLASIIWHEAYKEILTNEQINYMLKNIQSTEAIQKEISDGFRYFLVMRNSVPIGYFSYTKTDHVFLSKMYILNECRQLGFARKIIEYLKREKQDIVLRVNKENHLAINAYKKLSFKIIKEAKTDIGNGFYMDDYFMKLNFTFVDLINVESKQKYFIKLIEQIEEESLTNTIYPSRENWFKALELTPLENVKVVLIGQDPYFNPNQAMGLSFSVNKEVRKPPSLVNIYKELEAEYGKTMPSHGDLTSWAKQGVLLINAILTVNAGNPLSHSKFGWQKFTDEVIKLLQTKDNIVYFLLGGNAQKYESKITNKTHLILKTSHPSPLSSYRGFLGSGIFKKANVFLEEKGIKPIDWFLL